MSSYRSKVPLDHTFGNLGVSETIKTLKDVSKYIQYSSKCPEKNIYNDKKDTSSFCTNRLIIKKISNTKCETFQYLVDKSQSKHFSTDMDQIFIFLHWYQCTSSKWYTFTEDTIVYDYDKKGVGFCYNYICEDNLNPTPVQKYRVSPTYKEYPMVEVSL